MRKIRIAQIGINRNSHASDIFKTIRKLPEAFEVVGYALVEDEEEYFEKKKEAVEGAPRLSLDEILSDPTIEAVTVETDEIHLTRYARLAVAAGKQVHMEKPGSPSLSDFEELIALVKQNGSLLHLGYMYRYNSYISELIEGVKAGRLGKIYSVEAEMNCIHDSETRRWLDAFPGGMTFFLGCHLVDLVLQIQGEPRRVIPFNMVTGRDGVSATDLGFAVLEYENGVSFIKTSASEPGGFLRRQLVVNGERGCVELKPLERYVEPGLLVTERTECIGDIGWSIPGEHSVSEPADRYDRMMLAFASMVRGERENPYTPDYELTLFRTLLAACGQ